MKGWYKPVLVCVLLAGFIGCSSIESNRKYASLAAEHEFNYFFPSSGFTRSFSTIEEAYDFARTADAKFSKSVNKPTAKGLAAKLTGPKLETEQAVFLVCYMGATNTNGDVDLSKIDKPLESVVRESPSATLVYLIFYNDRIVSISDFHLASGYVYSAGNSQIKQFGYEEKVYEADYPIGWGLEKAFGYLRGEIN
jgi:hypothetical protein